MADRVTEKMIEAMIRHLAHQTNLTWQYETQSGYHNAFCQGSRICSAQTKSELYSKLEAVQNTLFTLERMNKLS